MYGISFNLLKFSFNMLGYELVGIVSLHYSAGREKLHLLLWKWWNILEEALRHSTITIVIVLGKTARFSYLCNTVTVIIVYYSIFAIWIKSSGHWTETIYIASMNIKNTKHMYCTMIDGHMEWVLQDNWSNKL